MKRRTIRPWRKIGFWVQRKVDYPAWRERISACPEDPQRVLGAFLDDPDAGTRAKAVNALTYLGVRPSRAVVRKMLDLIEHDPDQEVANLCAFLCVDFRILEARPRLVRRLDRHGDVIRKYLKTPSPYCDPEWRVIRSYDDLDVREARPALERLGLESSHLRRFIRREAKPARFPRQNVGEYVHVSACNTPVLPGHVGPSCPECRRATRLLLRLAPPLAPARIPFYRCLSCAVDTPFFVKVRGRPRSVGHVAADQSGCGLFDSGKERLGLLWKALPRGQERAGHDNVLGGKPEWLQYDETPACPECLRAMRFIGQISDTDGYPFLGNEGVLYLFWCLRCRMTATHYQQT